MDEELFYKEFEALDGLRNDMRGVAFHSQEGADARQHIVEAYAILNSCEDRRDLIRQADIDELVAEIDAAKDQINKLLAKYEGDEIQLENWVGELSELENLLKDNG